jgi:hypothetical protein
MQTIHRQGATPAVIPNGHLPENLKKNLSW